MKSMGKMLNSFRRLSSCFSRRRQAQAGSILPAVLPQAGFLERRLPSSRMPGNHIHGNGLPATFVPGRRNECEGCCAVDES